jgi:hypothetical protein
LGVVLKTNKDKLTLHFGDYIASENCSYFSKIHGAVNKKQKFVFGGGLFYGQTEGKV